jgi:anti-sigma factor RsiW
MSRSPCEQLDDFLDGCLSEGERAAFVDHLAGCAGCQGAVRDQRQIDELLAAAHIEFGAAPPGLRERIEQGMLRASRRRQAARVAAAAAALAAALASGVWLATLRPGATVVQRSPVAAPPIGPAAVPPHSHAVAPDAVVPPPRVRLTFDPGFDAIAVPVESSDPNVSIFWLYPAARAARPKGPPDADSPDPAIRSEI